MACSTAFESTILGLPHLVWSSTFLQQERNFFNHLVTVINYNFTFYTTNHFGCFHRVMAPIKLVKQCITCQRTYYHNTTNHALNCFSHVIYAPQTNIYEIATKLLTHPSIWYFIFKVIKYSVMLDEGDYRFFNFISVTRKCQHEVICVSFA